MRVINAAAKLGDADFEDEIFNTQIMVLAGNEYVTGEEALSMVQGICKRINYDKCPGLILY